MATWINPNVLYRAGFRNFRAKEKIEAKFYCILAFSIRGCILDDPTLAVEVKGEVEGAEYKLGIGYSANTVCRLLLGDDLVEDEKAWTEARKTKPPYLLLHFGPTPRYTCEEGLLKRTDSGILTYQCYPTAGDALKSLERKNVSRVVTALTMRLSSDQHHIHLVPIQRGVYGTTTGGETLHDLTIRTSGASLLFSYHLEETELCERLKLATRTASSVYQKAARFFHLGLDEEDTLKRFLYFFLCIEVLTHNTFKSINKYRDSEMALKAPARVVDSVNALFVGQRHLSDRFVCCAAYVWKSINDHDVVDFKRLKDVRDGIAHGRIEEPEVEHSESAERLAMKLLRDS